MILKFRVQEQTITAQSTKTVPRRGSKEYLCLQFSFSSDWEGLDKVCYLQHEAVSEPSTVLNDEIKVPEWFTEQEFFDVTLLGRKGDTEVPTNVARVMLEESNNLWQEDAPEPQASWLESALQASGEAVAAAEVAKASGIAAAQSAEDAKYYAAKTEASVPAAFATPPWYQGVDLTEKFADEIANYDSPWAWIQARIKAANYDGLHIGDFIPFNRTNTGVRYEAQIAGIDTYYDYGDGNNVCGHHIDFITRETIGWYRRVNVMNWNNGSGKSPYPWLASELYLLLNNLSGMVVEGVGFASDGGAKHFYYANVDYTNSGMLGQLPSALRNCIVEKYLKLEKRHSANGLSLTTDNGSDWASIGKLWLPTEFEVYGANIANNSFWASGGSMVQYPIFAGNCNRIKRNPSGNRSTWWLLTPATDTSEYWCCVSGRGNGDRTLTSIGYEFPVCFRIA